MGDHSLRHLISWKDWTDEEIKYVLNLAKQIKQNPEKFQQHMSQKTLVMIFQKTSTRTRVSFESGMTRLGGHAIFLDWMTSNFGLTEIWYEAAYLSRNCDIMMARIKLNEDLLQMVKGATVPIINGCCDLYHPCQAMADMLTILMDRGSMEGAKLTFVGVHNNVVNSLMATCAALDVHLTLVCPIAEEKSIDLDIKKSIIKKGLLTETLDLKEAVQSADYAYTDTWVDMEFFNNPEFKDLKQERLDIMMPYQLNGEVVGGSDAKIMHDMPIHPGYEMSDDLVGQKNSIIFDQAENRRPAQQAIMLNLLGLT